MHKKISLWKVECNPWNRGAINSMTIYVVAEHRNEARTIIEEQAHKFFDQDMRFTWGEPVIEGYQQT